MIDFVVFGIILALLCKRNPLHLIKNLSFRAPVLLLASFALQILLAVFVNAGYHMSPLVLEVCFLGMVVGLVMNRSIRGVKLIAIGSLLNLIALVAHGGLMPVSVEAMRAAGLGHYNLSGVDSRHQAMGNSAIWWLGDWIPFLRHVYSPGDLFVGLGIVRLIFSHSIHSNIKESTP